MIRMFKNDWGIKILALCIAVLLWLFVHGSGQNSFSKSTIMEQTFSVLPRVENVAEGLQLVTSINVVDVRIKGKKSFVSAVQKKDLMVFLDFAGVKEGLHTLPLRASLPAGIELVNINPGQIEVQLDRIVTQQIPVTVELIGHPMAGYSVEQPGFKPTEVLVTGPSSMVANVVKGVVNVSVDQLISSVSGDLPVRLVGLNDKTVENLKVEPSIVNVFVPIMQSMPAKQVPIKIRLTGEPDPAYKVVNWAIEPSFIQITGSIDYLKELEVVNTKAISVADAVKDVVKEVDLVIPEGYNSASSSKVRVVVKIEPKLENKTFSDVAVEIKNLSEDFSASLAKNKVVLVVEGKLSLLESITAGSISAWVDAGGMTEGETTVPVKVDLPEGVKLVSKEPMEIKIIIKNKS